MPVSLTAGQIFQRRTAAMRSDDLTRDQARALKNKLQPMLGYLNRLKKRMVSKGFPPDDPLLAAVCHAENAVHELCVEVHYLACGDSVGHRPDTAATKANPYVPGHPSVP
jgi:hypothetical protein